MSLCEHCVSGVRHEGTPEGKFEEIAGVSCYVATPSGDYAKEKVILYLTDIFGVELPNHQFLADDYARNGLKVVIPDILNKDPAPADALDPGSTWDFMPWLGRHGMETVHPVLDKVIPALKVTGVQKIAVLGYCYGARPAFDLAFKNTVSVVAVSHPSLLQVPADLEKYSAESKAPLLINSCEVDQMFPKESQAKADEILGGGKFAPGYVRTYWEGCTHGFSVRGDMSDPKVKAGKEGAFKATVEFLKKHL
ncbi:alpha/beta-hydrolase [Laetiporus sulphureus 93-53]|uniref:Alpha/beta-hydrolase n=1 Tax=Laetiporus sulphureus 93-53 TaxID=1314785 RepID=A0A165G4Z8_9APHY|nr:alpha/beta-hydrolase [Laetiporus sulphureus 93-53]KZT09837.1 alpha/beta-hydrolase [Laetiporus sulphureus 93-53]